MLDRVGGEHARATTIVRYAPTAGFPRHTHTAGEEILVLSGTFSEGSCDYPAGWYLRNPPGSSHQPHSLVGTTIFVKLGQMRAQEQRRVRIDTGDPSRWHFDGKHQVCQLFKDGRELVFLVRLAPREGFQATESGGVELLVFAGDALEGDQTYDPGSWLRLPPGERLHIKAGVRGATIYLKTGHLAGNDTE